MELNCYLYRQESIDKAQSGSGSNSNVLLCFCAALHFCVKLKNLHMQVLWSGEPSPWQEDVHGGRKISKITVNFSFYRMPVIRNGGKVLVEIR